MLMPESGDSNVINIAIRHPATTGVYRDHRREFDTRSTVDIIRHEIANSAAKAIHAPCGPGTVAT